jgi:hypothetical protein
MNDEATDLMRQEVWAARRLVRLFRIERSGRLARRRTDIALRLIERRGQLIDELRRMEIRRRSVAPLIPAELGLTMAQLSREVASSEQSCLELVARLSAELRRLRGEGPASGLRDSTGGRLLGSG